MAACYADDVLFSDPAFGTLQGDDAKNMWRMLIRNAKDNLKITVTDIEAGEMTGSANWIAEYNFSKTGRPVVNRIHARFEFRDGKIIRHIDDFDLWKWSRQALGWTGILLGWSPWMKMKIQKSTHRSLQEYSEGSRIKRT